MPIPVHVAGSPSSLMQLASHLRDTFAVAVDETADRLSRERTDLEEAWRGPGSWSAYLRVNRMAVPTSRLELSARAIGRAVDEYAVALTQAQDLLARSRATARAGGLPVTDRVIGGPPIPLDPAWNLAPLPTTSSPESAAAHADWARRMQAYRDAEALSDEAFAHLSDASRQLVEDLGEQQSLLAELVELGQRMFPGLVGLPADHVLPLVERRLRASAARAGFFASISPEQSKLLYSNLFRRVDELEDAEALQRLTSISSRAGAGADVLMASLEVISRHEAGQSTNQILTAVGGGGVVGALPSIAGRAVSRSRLGAVGGPWGVGVVGVLSVGGGAVAAKMTSDKVDNWYTNREFEQMVRDHASTTDPPGGEVPSEAWEGHRSEQQQHTGGRD